MEAEQKYRSPLIGKMAQILDYLSRQDASFSDIAKALDLPKSSTYVLLRSLLDIGFVRLLPDKRLYALGFKLFELGALSVKRINVGDQAMPHLRALRDAVDLTCHLGCLHGTDAFYLVKLLPHNKLHVNSWEGKHISLYSSGVGKALLAWQPERELDRLIKTCSFKPITPTTLASPDALRNNLAEIRRQQWAFDNEEDGQGLRCIAAPIFSLQGDVSAAVSISGPLQQVNDATVPRLVEEVKKTARAITQAVGGTYPPLES